VLCSSRTTEKNRVSRFRQISDMCVLRLRYLRFSNDVSENLGLLGCDAVSYEFCVSYRQLVQYKLCFRLTSGAVFVLFFRITSGAVCGLCFRLRSGAIYGLCFRLTSDAVYTFCVSD
jgi:hypothetical protein